MEQSPCELIAAVARQIGGRFRLKLHGASEPEPWSSWLIAPTAGYLEVAEGGPWPWRALEWIEVEPTGSGATAVVAAFTAIGLPAEVLGGNVRIPCAV